MLSQVISIVEGKIEGAVDTDLEEEAELLSEIIREGGMMVEHLCEMLVVDDLGLDVEAFERMLKQRLVALQDFLRASAEFSVKLDILTDALKASLNLKRNLELTEVASTITNLVKILNDNLVGVVVDVDVNVASLETIKFFLFEKFQRRLKLSPSLRRSLYLCLGVENYLSS